MPLGLERFGSRALHVDLDRASLDQGGVGAAGRVVQADVAAACKFLEGQLERQRESWDGQPEAAAAQAKQLSDDSEAMTKASPDPAHYTLSLAALGFEPKGL